MNYIEFGIKVLKIRKDCGFTREKVRDITGISIETLRRLEAGMPEPRINTLEKLSILYRYDLLELLAMSRSQISFFSEDLIRRSTEKINKLDFEGLRNVLDDALHDVMNWHNSDESEVLNFQYYTDFFNALKSLKLNETKDLKMNVIMLENILFAVSRNQKKLLEEAYLYPFEVVVVIYLISLYRRTGQHARAISTCEVMMDKLEKYPYLNDRGVDQLGALYQTFAYVYHAMDNHLKVIEIVDAAFSNPKLAFTNTLYVDLLMRKAIAFYELGNKDSYDIFTVAIQNSFGERKKGIIRIIKDIYDIDHHLATDL